MEQSRPPSFVELFIRLCKEDIASRHYGEVIPWCLALCLVIGFVVGNVVSMQIWRDKANLVTIFSALVTAQGVLLALSLNSVQQVFLTISSGSFSKWLKSNTLLDGYIFLIRFQQLINVLSLVFLVFALFFIYLYDNCVPFLDFPFVLVRFNDVVCFVVSLASGVFLYSLKQTADSFRMASDLTYFKAEYEAMLSRNCEPTPPLRPAPSAWRSRRPGIRCRPRAAAKRR